jgi:hypothetical protein
MGIDVNMVYPLGIESTRPSNEPMDFIILGEQKLCKIGTILTGNTSD